MRDPFPGLAALPPTQHPYGYVNNNPVNLTNPGGEFAPVIIAAGVGAVIGAVGDGVGYVLTHPRGRPEEYLRSGGFRRLCWWGWSVVRFRVWSGLAPVGWCRGCLAWAGQWRRGVGGGVAGGVEVSKSPGACGNCALAGGLNRILCYT